MLRMPPAQAARHLFHAVEAKERICRSIRLRLDLHKRLLEITNDGPCGIVLKIGINFLNPARGVRKYRAGCKAFEIPKKAPLLADCLAKLWVFRSLPFAPQHYFCGDRREITKQIRGGKTWKLFEAENLRSPLAEREPALPVPIEP